MTATGEHPTRHSAEGRSMARRHWLRLALGASVAVFGALWFGTGRLGIAAQERVRSVDMRARRYAFAPDTIEVGQDELVRVVFTAEDMPHSFTIDEYRIAKRAEPGRPVRFEFRADRAGRFSYHCDLKSDDGCRDMRGTLVVHPR